MYNGNAVYNFQAFEEQKQSAKIYSLPSISTRKRKKQQQKLRVYMACFSGVVSLGAAIGGLLFGQAKLVEYNSKITTITSELEEIKGKNEQLSVKLSAICDNKKDYEEEKCVEIITVAAGDKAEIK